MYCRVFLEAWQLIAISIVLDLGRPCNRCELGFIYSTGIIAFHTTQMCQVQWLVRGHQLKTRETEQQYKVMNSNRPMGTFYSSVESNQSKT